MISTQFIFLHFCTHPTRDNDNGRLSTHSEGANRGLSKSTAVKIESKSESNGKKKCFLVIKFFLGLLLFGLVLICTVLSKVTLISLTDKLRNVTVAAVNQTLKDTDSRHHDVAVSLYWQLLLVVMVPNVIACVRSLAFGVLGKTTTNFPWPTRLATILVSACMLVHKPFVFFLFFFIIIDHTYF